MNRTLLTRLLFLFASVSALTAVTPRAADALPATRGWAAGKAVGTNATLKDLVPRMSGEEAYIERYIFSADLDSGGKVNVDFTISNMGWGDGHGAARVRVKLPGHSKYRFSKKLSKGKWAADKKGFKLDIAKTTVHSVDGKTFHIKHNGKVKLDLVYKNIVPMWKPGRGQVDVKDGYYSFHLISPRAQVVGRVFMDGKWHNVRSTDRGYADHVATNIAPYDFAQNYARSRYYEGDLFVTWRNVKLSRRYGGGTYTWVMISYKDRVVFSDPRARLRLGKSRKDIRTGYKPPYAVQIDARQGKDHIKLIMRGTEVRKTNLLKTYNAAVKAVASAVSKPFRYEFPCTYALQMEIQGARALVRGKAHYTFDYVN